MQASVLKGPRKKMPVWTAFITYLVASPAWVLVNPSTPKIIELRELQRYVFTEDYTPQISARGGCELRFLQTKGMTLLSCFVVVYQITLSVFNSSPSCSKHFSIFGCL